MKSIIKKAYLINLFLLLFTFSLLLCCKNPTGDAGTGEAGTFTINLGGNSRVVNYPPNLSNPAELAQLRFEVKFSGAVTKTFIADGTTTLTGKIATGDYTVDVDVFYKGDGSLLSIGGATSNPVTITTGSNIIQVALNKAISISPPSGMVPPGTTQIFGATVYNNPTAAVSWEVSGNSSAGTTIDPNTGLLSVDAGETAIALEVTASYGSSPVWRGAIDVFTSSGGSGTSLDPFLVYDVTTLQRVGKGTGAYSDWDLTAHYLQTANIDMLGQTFTRIGDGTTYDVTYFKGSYDGDGFSIDSLTIIDSYIKCQGLFGYVGIGGQVINVTLNNCNISNYSNTGGVAGNNEGTVENCHVSGTVKGEGGSINYIGGVVGCNYGTVQNCSFSGTVSINNIGTLTGFGVGGVVGFNGYSVPLFGTVQNCYSIGTVSGEYAVGGVVGDNRDPGIVQNCYSTTNVSGYQQVGGVVGHNRGNVQFCYATGSITGITGNPDGYPICDLGGVTGQNYDPLADIKNCVALNGSVTTTDTSAFSLGRVTGENWSLATSTNNYARSTGMTVTYGGIPVSITPNPNDIHGDDVSAGTSSGEYNDQFFWETALGWDFASGTVWKWSGGTNLPQLWFE